MPEGASGGGEGRKVQQGRKRRRDEVAAKEGSVHGTRSRSRVPFGRSPPVVLWISRSEKMMQSPWNGSDPKSRRWGVNLQGWSCMEGPQCTCTRVECFPCYVNCCAPGCIIFACAILSDPSMPPATPFYRRPCSVIQYAPGPTPQHYQTPS